MSTPVFWLPEECDPASGATVALTGAEGHHAADVRRLRTGERVELVDGAGLRVRGRVATVERGWLSVDVETVVREPAPSLRIEVVQALPKGDRAELAVELLTEVGVDVIVPWAAARCVTRWRGDRPTRGLQRWQAAAREAAKQSRRAYVPDVTPMATTADVVSRLPSAALALVLDESATESPPDVPDHGDVMVIVGPEGGISEYELAAFDAAGARAVRLGPTVMRTSTAGAVAVAILLSRTPRWG